MSGADDALRTTPARQAGTRAGTTGTPRPPDSPRERYRAAVAALAAPVQERLIARDRAQHDLVAARRTVTDRLTDSLSHVSAADAALGAARRAQDRTETQAAQVWREVVAFCGRRRRDLGELPEPAPEPSGASAATLLDRARTTLARARRGELPLPPPIPDALAMLVAGIVGALVLAGVAVALASASHQMTGPEHAMVRVVADIARVAAPLGGLPIGLTWLTRYGQPVTARLVVLLLGAGIVVGYGLAALVAL